MKKILLVCSAGMSTSLLVTKMKEAAKQIHSKMKIVPVKTLQDAIDYLKKK